MARRGVGIREMARDLGCSRNTVRRYLKDPNATRYRGRPPRPVKLDPFKPYLLERVAAATPDYYASDCPMAGHQIESGVEGAKPPTHPLTLLRKAYGV